MSIDKNSDRLINKKEFSTALGMMPNDTYLSNAIFDAIDANKNGEISFEEYMDTMAVLLHGTPDERLVSMHFLNSFLSTVAFTFFDVEKDFQVTHQEVEKMLLGVFKILSGLNIPSFEENDAIQYAAELFELLDVHKVGVIKFEDFKEVMPKISNKIIGLGRLKSNKVPQNLSSPGDTVLWGSKSWNTAFEMMIVFVHFLTNRE
jgi:Ca2+-binding EF-hand superfamily protein